MEIRSVTVLSRVLDGEVPRLVHVEVSFTPGKTTFYEIDNLPPAEVDFYARTMSGALERYGYELKQGHLKVVFRGAAPRPQHCLNFAATVGLAVITEQIDPECLKHYEFTGFVNIEGELMCGRGALLAIRAASQDGRCSVVAERDWRRLSLIENSRMLVAENIEDVVEHLRGSRPRAHHIVKAPALPLITPDICQLLHALPETFEQTALTTVCAGAHSFLVQGPDPEANMDAANSVRNLLPDLDTSTALEAAMRLDLAGITDTDRPWGHRPLASFDCWEYLCEPRRTPQDVACVESAHHGVFFVPAAPRTIEARGWLEGYTDLSQQRRYGTLPTKFQLVMAEPNCECKEPGSTCNCIPLLDADERKAVCDIRHLLADIKLSYNPMFMARVLRTQDIQPHIEQLRSRITAAREIQLSRAGKLNAQLTDQEAEDLCALTLPDEQMPPAARNRLREAQASPKIKRIARTLADLDASDEIEESHKTMAANLFLGFCLFSPQT